MDTPSPQLLGAASLPAAAGPPRRRRRRLLWFLIPSLSGGLLLLALLLLVLALNFCVGGPVYYSDKYSPAGPAHPTSLPGTFVPEHQTEGHTCGLHALSSIYAAYGLDPQSLRLRFRLGVDKPFSNFVPDSRGTIHPDMLRVLHQDGFDTEVLLPEAEASRARLEAHLDAGHPAVALIKVGELHWIVLTARDADNARICDSLRDRLYDEPLEAYLHDRVYSLILVRPREADADPAH